MKNKAIKTKLLTVLLALCMVLSLVPMTAFATTIELPAGVSRKHLYNHTYHTKVEITANVSVKDAGGSVIETTQVNKSGDFIEGNVSSTAVQTEIQRIDAEINAPFSSKGTLAVENRTKSLEFDHFDGNNLYSFIPASGDTVNFGTDTEAIEQYFAEHPDAVGTFNTFNDLHEYQVYFLAFGEGVGLFDLLVIDLLWWRSTKRIRFSFLPEKKYYQDPKKHIESFLRGIPLFAATAALTALIVTA